ncbi:cell division topological specificity factor MinE [Azospirillum sp. ST 5-10]|uniref:cell division topological specificity factor MinE n=1 Tax=unclassified Azospirillum TaxID=2630922 RepID=UPI003F4A1FFF
MSIFSFFRSTPKTSATQAKERLQIVMAHERVGRTGPDYLPMLQQELLSVIAKYVDIDENKVEVKLDRGGDCSTLEVNIELPSRDAVRKPSETRAAGPGAARGGDGKPGEKAGDAKAEAKSTPPSAGAVLTNGGVSKRH